MLVGDSLAVSHRPKPTPSASSQTQTTAGIHEATLTHVQPPHERYPPVHDTKLLVVRPEQHHAVARPVDGLERVGRRLGDAGGVERHVAEAGAQVLGEVVAGGAVLRVAEDGDVGVEGLEVLAGVLGRV